MLIPQHPGYEDIAQHRALEESRTYYGGGPENPKNPLELLIDNELDRDREKNDEACEILLRMLAYVTHDPEPGKKLKWVRHQVRLLPGQWAEYIRADFQQGTAPIVKIKGSDGAVVREWTPAIRKAHYKARPEKGERYPSVEIKVLEWVTDSFATVMVKRLLSLAYIGGVDELRDKTGAGLAAALGVTRQAVSLTNKAMDAQVQQSTGGKTRARGLRGENPNKGKTRDEIKAKA